MSAESTTSTLLTSVAMPALSAEEQEALNKYLDAHANVETLTKVMKQYKDGPAATKKEAEKAAETWLQESGARCVLVRHEAGFEHPAMYLGVSIQHGHYTLTSDQVTDAFQAVHAEHVRTAKAENPQLSVLEAFMRCVDANVKSYIRKQKEVIKFSNKPTVEDPTQIVDASTDATLKAIFERWEEATAALKRANDMGSQHLGPQRQTKKDMEPLLINFFERTGRKRYNADLRLPSGETRKFSISYATKTEGVKLKPDLVRDVCTRMLRNALMETLGPNDGTWEMDPFWQALGVAAQGGLLSLIDTELNKGSGTTKSVLSCRQEASNRMGGRIAAAQ